MTSCRWLIFYDGRFCTICQQFKDWSDYFVIKQSKTGYMACCKVCYMDRVKTRSPYKYKYDPIVKQYRKKKRVWITPCNHTK